MTTNTSKENHEPHEGGRRRRHEVAEDFKRREVGLDMAKNLTRSESHDRNRACGETEQERRVRKLGEVIEDIRRTSPGFRASDRLPREAIYDRDRARAEARAVAEKEDRSPAESSDAT